MKGQVIIEY